MSSSENIKFFKEKYNRPILIEVAGTPNSGKTYAIEELATRLQTIDPMISCNTIYEAARNNKYFDKLSPMFNYWTLCETLKSLLQCYRSSEYDVIICERGFFDHLCWFEFFYLRSALDNEEYAALSNFILCMLKEIKTDIVFSFQCTADVSINRDRLESENPSIWVPGRIVNHKVISEYNEANDIICARYIKPDSAFSRIIKVDTTNIEKENIQTLFFETVLEEIVGLLQD